MTIALSPANGLRDSATYPTNPGSEAAARDQIQGVIDQVVSGANTDIGGKMTKGKLSETSFMGNYGGNWVPHTGNLTIAAGTAYLVAITTNTANAVNVYYSGLFLVHCDIYGNMFIKTISEQYNGGSVIVQSVSNYTYIIKNAGDWGTNSFKPNINVIQIV